MKVIYLFTESIITHQEFMSLVNAVPWFDSVLVMEIRSLTSTRIESRRRSTLYFKPLKDTEFKNAERVTHSYVRMHHGYACS